MVSIKARAGVQETVKGALTRGNVWLFLALLIVAVAARTALFTGPWSNAPTALKADVPEKGVIVIAARQIVRTGREPSEGQVWSSGWSQAWRNCRDRFPTTRSIDLPFGNYHTTNRTPVPGTLKDEYDHIDIVSGWICNFT